MTEALNCPNCNAPLEYDGMASTVQCSFCGSTVVVPEELRSAEPVQVTEQNSSEFLSVNLADEDRTPEKASSSNTVWNWLAVAFAVVVTLAVLGLGFNVLDVRTRIGLTTVTLQPTPTLLPSPTPFAHLVFSFGKKGSGAGYFNDPRSIAVDFQGRIFVGDYLPGRIHAFSADGAFLWQQILPDEHDYVGAMTADLQGHLYVVVSRDIWVIDSATGNILAKWQPTAQQIGYYQAIAVTPRGEILAVMQRELVKLDSQGNLLLQVGGLQEDFLKKVGVKDTSVGITGLAVDGIGNIYISTSGDFLLKLDQSGSLIDRLSGSSIGKAIEAMAIDGQGRLFWKYSNTVVVTDTDGKYVAEFKSHPLRDIEIDIKGQLVGVQTSPPLVEIYAIGR